MGVPERIASICHRDVDERELRVAVLAELRAEVPFDAFAWLLTDPVTCVGASPVAQVPDMSDLARVIRAKYLSVVNRWTGLVPGVTATLVGAAGPDRTARDTWGRVLAELGIADVASVVLRDAAGCWSFIDLWRRSGPFTAAETHLLDALNGLVTPALRRAHLRTFATASTPHVDGPAVLLLDDDLTVLGHTERSETYLRALLPTVEGNMAIPAAAFNVAAQLLAVEAGIDDRPAQARVHVAGCSWMTTRAARTTAPTRRGRTIAVSIEPTPPSERASLYACVAGLTGRETEVLQTVVAGRDSRSSARILAISEHTLQDHLKSIFAKTGTDSRRLLIARATGAAQ